MKNRTAISHIVIAIFFSVLSCRFATVTFAQDSGKMPHSAVKNIESDARSFSTDNDASVSKKLVNQTDTRMSGSLEGQPATKKAIRDFVLYNYARLADDIINGEGMYLETLYYLMEIEEQEQNHCQQKFLALLLENIRIPEFSESIAGYDQKD